MAKFPIPRHKLRFPKFKTINFWPRFFVSKSAKRLFFALIILMTAILQITLVDSFKIFSVKPDLILLMAVIASFYFEFKETVTLSIFAGVLKDILGVGFFGINTLLFPLWSFLINKLNRQISIDNNILRIIIIFVITWFHNAISGSLLVYTGSIIPLGIFLRIVFLESIYTAIALPWVLKFIEKKFSLAETSP